MIKEVEQKLSIRMTIENLLKTGWSIDEYRVSRENAKYILTIVIKFDDEKIAFSIVESSKSSFNVIDSVFKEYL